MEKKTIGGFLAALRKTHGLTQQEVADRLNVSNKTVSKWERDESAPDLALIPVLAELYGVTCARRCRAAIKSNGWVTAYGTGESWVLSNLSRWPLYSCFITPFSSSTRRQSILSLSVFYGTAKNKWNKLKNKPSKE